MGFYLPIYHSALVRPISYANNFVSGVLENHKGIPKYFPILPVQLWNFPNSKKAILDPKKQFPIKKP